MKRQLLESARSGIQQEHWFHFFGRDPLVPGICLIWNTHTHTSIGTSEASRIRMPKVENHALRRIFLQINMLSRWMIGPLDDSLVLTTGRELADDGFRYPSSHFRSLGALGLSYIEVTPRSWENCVLYEYRNRNGFVVTVVRHLK